MPFTQENRQTHLRRKFEILGVNDSSTDVLSSLLHLRAVPDRPIGGGTREPLTANEVAEGASKISEAIPAFDYEKVVGELRDLDILKAKFATTDVGYEKVQIFRIMLEIQEPHEDDTFKKFVNETFHIENEYVMQLDPREFDSVPEFVVKECVRQAAMMAAA